MRRWQDFPWICCVIVAAWIGICFWGGVNMQADELFETPVVDVYRMSCAGDASGYMDGTSRVHCWRINIHTGEVKQVVDYGQVID